MQGPNIDKEQFLYFESGIEKTILTSIFDEKRPSLFVALMPEEW